VNDITRALREGHPNWPGDTPLSLKLTADMTQGSSVNIMALTTSTHCGTHLDAPFHYSENGARLGSISLSTLIGPALVLDARSGITPDLLEPYPDLPERVLFFTGEPSEWRTFPEDFTPLTPDVIHALADRGVRLVGTDAPSVDALSSKDLPSHKACLARELLILEGLDLQGVPEGLYELICLPLNLPDADASPVRALLRPQTSA
jgi:arylformamidase